MSVVFLLKEYISDNSLYDTYYTKIKHFWHTALRRESIQFPPLGSWWLDICVDFVEGDALIDELEEIAVEMDLL